jgi:excisionase family DNA binding protein
MKSPGPRFLTSREVAVLCQASPSAVLRWIDLGLLEAHRTPGGHRRVASPKLVEFLIAHRMPVPRELRDGQVRVLVIDDEAQYLRSLGPLLTAADARVEVELAESAIDGLLKIGVSLPDVVLLDAYMPGMDGLEACRRIKQAEATHHIAVVAITGRPSPELHQAFTGAGAQGFLPKPLAASAVLEELRRLDVIAAPSTTPRKRTRALTP